MLAKKVTALLVSAALVLALLAGCGGGQQSVARTLLNLLDGKYTNVSVEMDSELEAALRQAVRGAETKAEIRAALENILGPGISFQLLGDGQKGDTAWNLILYPGSDPDAAGRSGFVEWNKVFSALPKDGQYTAQVAMIETDNGYALLVQATVDRAGSRDDDNDDDEPEEPKEPYKVTVDESGTVTAVTVGTSEGLNYIFSGTGSSTSGNEQEKQALETARNIGFEGVTITLSAGQTYTVDTSTAPLAETFKGTLKGESAASKAQITLSGDGGYGLFNQIETGGTVENIRINVKDNISEGYTNPSGYIWAGAVAGCNYGTITGCEVTIDNDKSITGTIAGGIVGMNENEISDCTVTGGTITGIPYAGGIVGYNKNGTIEGSCTVKDTSVSATSTGSNANAGGLVGQSYGQSKSSTVNGSYTGNGTISATSTSGYANAGGLVGNNIDSAKVTGSYNGSGAITAIIESTGSFFAAFAGGLVGHNSEGTVSASYTGNSKIEAKAAKAGGGYDIATVTSSGPSTDVAPEGATGSNIRASAGTGIGYDETGDRPIATTELPWPKT
ncbi:hypothetical protein B5G28_12065 [Faecalibacterium sp. An77]|uniref:hypothetical protein n=1 Tax=Faecalibacterium sp. An77 TaxID=1965655 RepID=UPI000B36F460|nr:hypothetical protein [Faecalibacterium sp. An77]OUN36427.1 hypothetical protein B5G28_12065 [Faecalibacterium sp. An77]